MTQVDLFSVCKAQTQKGPVQCYHGKEEIWSNHTLYHLYWHNLQYLRNIVLELFFS